MNDSKCNIDFTPIQTPNDNHFSRGTWKNIVGGGGGGCGNRKENNNLVINKAGYCQKKARQPSRWDEVVLIQLGS